MKVTNNHKFFELSSAVSCLANPLNAHLNVSYFSFKRTYADGSKIYLFNNPGYYEHWFKKEHYLIGNREAGIGAYKDGYDLWEHLPDPHKLYVEGAELFNIAHGLTITKNHENYCDFFFFASTRENSEVHRVFFNQSSLLNSFCNYFVSSASHLLQIAEKNKIILPPAPVYKMATYEMDLDSFKREITLVQSDYNKLTARELECIQHLVHGRTNKEIARELQLSPRTVEEYTNNIKAKLGCKNRAELIAVLCREPIGTG